MGFTEYFYELAHKVFKRDKFKAGEIKKANDIELYTQSIGPNYDAAMESIFKLREQALITTATGKALDAHGQDRNLPRYPGEDDDNYRLRLLSAYSVYQALGTKTALVKALRKLGFEGLDIEELFDSYLDGSRNLDGNIDLAGPDRWAEFLVFMNWDIEEPLIGFDAEPVLATVQRMKPAHTKLAALRVQNLPTEVENSHAVDAANINRGLVNFWGNRILYLDGNCFLDGSFILNGTDVKVIYLDGENMLDGGFVLDGAGGENQDQVTSILNRGAIQNPQDLDCRLTVNYHLWFLDGTFDLDGAKNLDAAVIEYYPM